MTNLTHQTKSPAHHLACATHTYGPGEILFAVWQWVRRAASRRLDLQDSLSFFTALGRTIASRKTKSFVAELSTLDLESCFVWPGGAQSNRKREGCVVSAPAKQACSRQANENDQREGRFAEKPRTQEVGSFF